MLIVLIRRMLSLAEEERPRANEITGSLRLITLCEICKPLNENFDDHLRNDTLALDAIIECTRFHSWQYALDIREQRISVDAAIEAAAWQLTEFESILETLDRMDSAVKSLTSHLLVEETAPLYRLFELNDRLDTVLSRQLMEKSRLYFKISILHS